MHLVVFISKKWLTIKSIHFGVLNQAHNLPLYNIVYALGESINRYDHTGYCDT